MTACHSLSTLVGLEKVTSLHTLRVRKRALTRACEKPMLISGHLQAVQFGSPLSLLTLRLTRLEVSVKCRHRSKHEMPSSLTTLFSCRVCALAQLGSSALSALPDGLDEQTSLRELHIFECPTAQQLVVNKLSKLIALKVLCLLARGR